MAEASLVFRILMVVILLVFTIVFAALYAYDRDQKAPAWIALAYFIGLTSFLFDLGRSVFDPVISDILAKIALWMVSAFWVLSVFEYHKVRPPRAVLLSIFGVGLSLLLWFSLKQPDIIQRSIFSSSTGGLLLACALPILWRYRKNMLETAWFWAFAGLSATYFVRPVIIYGLLGERYTETSYNASSYAALLHSSSALWGLACGLVMMLVMGNKIIEKHLLASIKDPLTGLLNRRGLDNYVSTHWSSKKNKKRTLLILDLDHFKSVNDEYGHEAGDQVLVRTADMLRTLTHGLATIARIGGEEFVILLNKMEAKDARLVAEHLRLSIGMIMHPELGKRGTVTASIGMASMFPQESFAMALRRADQALYQAKTRGRNLLVVAPEDRREPHLKIAQ
ncbi:GGDEF domain-containing protein [Parasphingorhabdus cellanae]|uniref:diguanylate cyclase n=1 Tax=Parasphingorhabdus cellanae TaxID=2806553 RepID=A0ABX7T124_9SPHN|nr:GGDEF domain-containing protein [Parasphingorhabdus cellanae]QTD55254.1 GGDEF domain-containing protein [Parasphingorhabdus cellanae]